MSCHGVNDHSVCHCRRRARQFRHDEAVHTIRDHFADGSVAKAVHHNRWRKPCALSDKQQTLARARLAEGQSVAAIARELNTSRQTIMRLRARSVEHAIC
ncbi:MAG: helix-turn-helix domain-containing protein [Pseudomonadota bacterium]|jgi:DNA-binding NarL/FixJ family response regulator|uniref:helix-turn-helix domain-containing protein n=1 Tax=Cupriavidus TaxID=106589 RepID=UPI001CB92B3D|nr:MULTISPECIES: helix-turn-helix domain-containing protein [Cupriavidus]